MGIFSLFSTAFSCVVLGVIATAAIMAVLYLVLRSLNEGIVRSVPFYLSGALLFILLAIELSLLIGAVKANGMLNRVETSVVMTAKGIAGTFDSENSRQLIDKIVDEVPLLEIYIDSLDLQGYDRNMVVAGIIASIHKKLMSYIRHRVLWILGFIVLACMIAVISAKNTKGNVRRNRSAKAYANRGTRAPARRHSRYN